MHRPARDLPIQELTLRAVTAADDGLLDALLVAARPELDGLPPPFLAMQRAAQEAAYSSRSADGHRVVQVDGRPVGRVWTAAEDGAVVLLDLVVLPESRGRGVGAAVLEEVVVEAAGRPVRLHAMVGSAALRLYERAGFRRTGQDEVRVAMERVG